MPDYPYKAKIEAIVNEWPVPNARFTGVSAEKQMQGRLLFRDHS